MCIRYKTYTVLSTSHLSPWSLSGCCLVAYGPVGWVVDRNTCIWHIKKRHGQGYGEEAVLMP